MITPMRATVVILFLAHAITAPLVRAQQAEQSEREAMYHRYLEFASYVKGGTVQPHWMADGNSFWYAGGAPATTVIYKVDPRANASAGLMVNTKTPLFDTARLRQALSSVLGHEPPYQGLPFEEFTFVDDSETAVKFIVENKEFILQLDTYTLTSVPPLSEEEKNRRAAQVISKDVAGHPIAPEVLSPDRRWFATLKDHNLWIRSTYDGRSVQLTTDGVKDYDWGRGWPGPWAKWSPDNFKLAVKKVDFRKVPKIPIVHYLKPTEEVEWMHHPRAGGPMEQTELFVVDILSKRQVRIDIGEESDQFIYILGWRHDGSEVFVLRMNREFKKLDLMTASPTTGATRLILTETQQTFLQAFVPPEWQRRFTTLEEGQRFIWLSERNGWNHLYLYDLDGTLIRQLTRGPFPVERVVAVDEKAGWVYFTAHRDRQRPYDTHLYRVKLDGTGLARLTEATGQHEIHFAPSKQFFIDTHSTVARPLAVELRRADGTLLQTLSKANIDALKELKWRPPEEFVVKAADGKSDLYGVLFKPYDFDPNKKYPVIEGIYAGPQLAVVPRTFTYRWTAAALAQSGFIFFIVDGRGTPERGKAFQDVVYGNFGRHEIPDHVAALKQVAEKRAYMDLSRVGIFGYSWGGYFTLRALLLAPDVYHVGIAGAPLADMYDHPYWIEHYMGLPQNNREGYEYGSNLRLAGNLKGKLLLIHGTSDDNVPFSETMKMVEALIRTGKPYDLLVFPEQHHGFPFSTGNARTYFWEAIRRYFQEHLKP